MMAFKVSCAFLIFCVAAVQSARILGIIFMPSISHQIFFRPLWKELLLKGHQVTLLTTDPMNDPTLTNLTEINLHKSYSFFGDMNFIESVDKPVWSNFLSFIGLQAKLIDEQLSNPQVRKLIEDQKESFDLILIEGFHSAHYAFVERFKCPFISVLSLDATTFAYEEIRNPSHYVLHPDFMLPFQGQLSFSQRLTSTFFVLYNRLLFHFFALPYQQQIIEKHFGTNYSMIQDVYKNYSAFFLNTNNILQPIRPLLPNIVPIGGGTHISKKKPLPKDLQNVLDSSTEGAIYFSLGSNAKSKDISNNTLQSIISAFRELPYTVLWKFENEFLPNKPNNVIISKWFPQQDVLRHPNIKLFITQGGLQSTEEAFTAKVPLVGIPILGDQKSNVHRLASKGIALMLEYKSITKETFTSAILEVVTNPRYRDNMKMYSELSVDQSQTGLERAVWWTEYVLRHKGAYHLRNPALDLPWYQYYLLDVVGFCLAIVFIVTYLVFKTASFLLRLYKIQVKEKQL